jgi:hypothetical protein
MRHNTDGKYIFKTLVHAHGRKHKTALSVGSRETLEADEELEYNGCYDLVCGPTSYLFDR